MTSNSAFDDLPPCPACGEHRPSRSLILCRRCWPKIPRDLRLRAYTEARTNPQSVALGQTAAEVIASVKIQGHDREATTLRKGNSKRHRGSLAA